MNEKVDIKEIEERLKERNLLWGDEAWNLLSEVKRLQGEKQIFKDAYDELGKEWDRLVMDKVFLYEEVKRLQSEKDELLGKYIDAGEIIQLLRMDKFELEQEVKRLRKKEEK